MNHISGDIIIVVHDNDIITSWVVIERIICHNNNYVDVIITMHNSCKQCLYIHRLISLNDFIASDCFRIVLECACVAALSDVTTIYASLWRWSITVATQNFCYRDSWMLDLDRDWYWMNEGCSTCTAKALTLVATACTVIEAEAVAALKVCNRSRNWTDTETAGQELSRGSDRRHCKRCLSCSSADGRRCI
jgi:hypothetical protein